MTPTFPRKVTLLAEEWAVNEAVRPDPWGFTWPEHRMVQS